jgi:hypothetical protein
MAEKSVHEELVHRVTELSRIVMEHQAYILALVAYVREQPSYDSARFQQLFRECRKKMNLPIAEHQDADAALLELLRSFEGPIQ